MPRPLRSRIAVEVTDCGTYARVGNRRPIARTLVLSAWPLVAVDLDRFGGVVGIETIPRSAAPSRDHPMSGAR